MRARGITATRGAALIAIALGVATGPASAQEATYPAPEPRPRVGWTAGGTLGFGNIAIENSSAALADGDSVGVLSLGVHFGGMIKDDLAILVTFATDLHGCSDCFEDDQLVYSGLGLGVRYWPMERLWLHGGLSSARLGRIINGDRVWLRTGGALDVAVGYEVLSQPSYALDVQLSASLAGYKDDDMSSDAVALRLGLSMF